MRREYYLNDIEQAFKVHKIVALLGPRQCGKTTLAREYFAQHQGQREWYFDLENPTDLVRLQDPLLALEEAEDLVIIDEIQRFPDLFPILRVLADQPKKCQFLILGSASRELIRQSSESLAGRIQYIELTPFSFSETHTIKPLWVRGGFPRAYLAEAEQESLIWRRNYIRTFLEQDIPNLGIQIPPENLRRFWTMLAHYHGQLLNASELGQSLDITHHTTKRYLDILTGTFMVRQLQPWHENISKRQIKSPKIYFRDSGIYHALLNITSYEELLLQPKLGASWEGFALEAVIRTLKVDTGEYFFWGIHSSAELDLLIVRGTTRLGFEFKYTKTPSLTSSMKTALDILQLQKIIVIYPGDVRIRLTHQIECIGLENFLAAQDSATSISNDFSTQ